MSVNINGAMAGDQRVECVLVGGIGVELLGHGIVGVE